MANIYVRSTDGNNSDDGSTWALSKATLAGADAIDAAGDSIFVSSAHSESQATALTIAFGGSLTSPSRVLCVNDAAEPPTALATGAAITTTGASNIILGGFSHYHGFTVTCGTGSTAAHIRLGETVQGEFALFTEMKFRLGSTATGSQVRVNFNSNNQVGSRVLWKSCTVQFGNASQGVVVGNAYFQWRGGGIESGGTAPTTLVNTVGASNRGSYIEMEGLDLSAGGTSMNIFSTGLAMGRGVIRNSKLPTSWAGGLCSGTVNVGTRYEMYNCDSGDTNYKLWVEDHAGSIKQETTIVRTGGASDGTTAISWKFVTNANAEFPILFLESPEIIQWNSSTGSSKTLTIEVITDGVTLKDDECWLEAQYLGTSGYPLSTFVNDAKIVLATAADQTTSSETWTTTGLTSPTKQKLSVSLTPQEVGYFRVRVMVAKASTTVYVCPKLIVS